MMNPSRFNQNVPQSGMVCRFCFPQTGYGLRKDRFCIVKPCLMAVKRPQSQRRSLQFFHPFPGGGPAPGGKDVVQLFFNDREGVLLAPA